MNSQPENRPFPVKIQIIDHCLAIDWEDGKSQSIPIHKLRDHCPCATCREKSSNPAPLLPVLDANQTGRVSISKMEPVGHYAYGIQFSDGHETGVFTLDYLYSNSEFN